MSYANVGGYNLFQQQVAAGAPQVSALAFSNKVPVAGVYTFDIIPPDINTGSIFFYCTGQIRNLTNPNNPPNPLDPEISSRMQMNFVQSIALVDAAGIPVSSNYETEIVCLVQEITPAPNQQWGGEANFAPCQIPIPVAGCRLKVELTLTSPRYETLAGGTEGFDCDYTAFNLGYIVTKFS